MARGRRSPGRLARDLRPELRGDVRPRRRGDPARHPRRRRGLWCRGALPPAGIRRAPAPGTRARANRRHARRRGRRDGFDRLPGRMPARRRDSPDPRLRGQSRVLPLAHGHHLARRTRVGRRTGPRRPCRRGRGRGRATCHAPATRRRGTRGLVAMKGSLPTPFRASRMRRRLLCDLGMLAAGYLVMPIARAADAMGAGVATGDASGRTAGRSGESVEPPYAPVLRGHSLAFPRDHGMHPDFRIEWWYITGWLEVRERTPRRETAGARAPRDGPRPYGFQITFFRVRTRHSRDNPSRFAPHQLLLPHPAISDPALGRLRHDQQAWRAGGLAKVAAGDTGIELPGWRLARDPDDRYRAEVEAEEFGYRLRLAALA